MIRQIFILLPFLCLVNALVSPSLSRRAFLLSSHQRVSFSIPTTTTSTTLFEEPPDEYKEPTKRYNASKSGNKRGRLDKLAALEDERVDTDKSLFLKGGAVFLGLTLLLLVVGFQSGLSGYKY